MISIRLGVVLTLLCLFGCSDRATLQPLPDVRLEGLDSAVAAQIRAALETARARERDAEANGRLGMVLQAYLKLDEAEVAYRRTRLLAPDAFEWAYLHAVVLQGLGRNQDALIALHEAISRRPDDVAAGLRLAGLLAETGDAAGARNRYETLLRSRPDLPQANLGLGRLLLAGGEPAAAKPLLLTAVSAAPEYGAAHYALAQAYRELGDTAAAEQHAELFEASPLRDLPAQDPLLGAVAALNQSENSRFAAALALLQQNRRAEAAAAFERVVEVAPDNYSAHINLIGLYGDLGRPDDAERHFRLASGIDPTRPKLYNNVGIVRLRNERYPEAAEAFGEAVRLDPEYAAAHRNLGRALELQGETQGALDQYRAALALTPENRQIRFFLGRALLESGDPRSAIPELEAALPPEDAYTPWYMRTLAEAWFAAGDEAQGDETLAEARRLAQRYGQTRLVAEIDARADP